MKKNVGTADKTIRIIVGAIFGILVLMGQASGVLAVVLGIFAVVLIGTALFGYCPPYALFGINTCKR
ncbi:MAG TPA: DUF2892 domain-containing protein [Proteobacteria bacterium]|nr:hypothetical protein BMS3Abin14_00063 [bacterium BMS3Abin14]HDL53059.1 DUF2892 domain-containing protein [Pseudomonadota bacterium]